jgi:hypothetical protein
MKTKAVFLFCFILGISIHNVYSQLDKNTGVREGTYQIQVVNTRMQPAVPVDILQEVTKKRKKSERTMLSVSEHVRILIFSEEEINDPNFVAPKKFLYVVE